MTPHRGLDESDAAEIDARKARLDEIKRAHAERNGVAHPDKAPADPGLIDRALPDKSGSKSQQLLDVAAKNYAPGDVASPSRLAELLGTKPANVSAMIVNLEAKGKWPYSRRGRGRGPEKPAPAPNKPAPEPSLREPDPEPIRNGDPKADAELLVMQRVMSQLDRLPGISARRRVLAYLIDREGES